jgi:hypothetical protein
MKHASVTLPAQSEQALYGLLASYLPGQREKIESQAIFHAGLRAVARQLAVPFHNVPRRGLGKGGASVTDGYARRMNVSAIRNSRELLSWGA